jgi:hypothetical protein
MLLLVVTMSLETLTSLRSHSEHDLRSQSPSTKVCSLLNAMYRPTRSGPRSKLGCAMHDEVSATTNLVRQQTSAIESTAFTYERDSRLHGSFTRSMKFHRLGEFCLAHPKTFGFFQGCQYAIFVLDINTLQDLHPVAEVKTSTWIMQSLSTLAFRSPHRQIILMLQGIAEFKEVLARQSADDYLARAFDDYGLRDGYDSDSDSVRQRRPVNLVLKYVLRRFCEVLPENQVYPHLCDGSMNNYRMVFGALNEIFNPALLYWGCGASGMP